MRISRKYNIGQFDRLIPDRPFRERRDLHLFLMRALEFMYLYDEFPEAKPAQPVGELMLHVDKISRLVLRGPRTRFTMGFPFHVEVHEGKQAFCDAWKKKISAMEISGVIAILTEEGRRPIEGDFWDLIELIESTEREFDTDLAGLYYSLMGMEDGYCRFDTDEVRANGRVHPLHHIDVFLKERNGLKIGLYEDHSIDQIMDIFDLSTDCRYLESIR